MLPFIFGRMGQADGFLPNKEELNLLYAQRNVVGSFASSSIGVRRSQQRLRLVQVFGNGDQFDNGKDTVTLGVRAVRAF